MIRRLYILHRGVTWTVAFNDEAEALWLDSVSLPQAPTVELLPFLSAEVLEALLAAIPKDRLKGA